MRLIVTGGAGFIGSALVRHLVEEGHQVLNLDKLTYAGNLKSLDSVSSEGGYHFQQLDICDAEAVNEAFTRFQPDGIYHLAAESHVDRSIDGPGAFIQTNLVGTYTLLDRAKHYWSNLSEEKRKAFRFLHVSTDEVYGTLGETGKFLETTPYQPNSPYSASKAGSDHLVRAWFHTFGFPVVTTNCTNNYGPFQFPEKLIPLCLLKATEGQPLPIYGKGENVRDWLYVEDHVSGLETVFQKGRLGETYNIGGESEKTNIDVVKTLCAILDEFYPEKAPHENLITYVTDRPGHDMRYAMDITKIKSELGWQPKESFETGLRKTVQWYLENSEWIDSCREEYRGQRLGQQAEATV